MNLTKILAGLLLVLAIALGIGAWMLSRQPVRQVAAPSAPAPAAAPTAPTEMHNVVVAAKAVPAGQRLTAEDLKVAQLPAAVANSFASTEPVVGRTTVVALQPDSPLFEQQLLNGLALQIEPGQRAVAIAVKDTMAAGHHVRPGDFVDVFFTLEGKADQTDIDTQARLLLARSRVLAYGAASVENPPPTAAQQRQAQQEADSGNAARRGSASREGTSAAPANANTAVLAVALEDVERLALAEKYGKLTLALRHPDDTSVPNPALFASLPTVLQPVAARLKKDEALPPADRAFAGLHFKDLAVGAKAPAPRTTAAPVLRAQAPLPTPAGAASNATQSARGNTVEMYQGANLQTVNY